MLTISNIRSTRSLAQTAQNRCEKSLSQSHKTQKRAQNYQLTGYCFFSAPCSLRESHRGFITPLLERSGYQPRHRSPSSRSATTRPSLMPNLAAGENARSPAMRDHDQGQPFAVQREEEAS